MLGKTNQNHQSVDIKNIKQGDAIKVFMIVNSSRRGRAEGVVDNVHWFGDTFRMRVKNKDGKFDNIRVAKDARSQYVFERCTNTATTPFSLTPAECKFSSSVDKHTKRIVERSHPNVAKDTADQNFSFAPPTLGQQQKFDFSFPKGNQKLLHFLYFQSRFQCNLFQWCQIFFLNARFQKPTSVR